jgi:hypothetical protein
VLLCLWFAVSFSEAAFAGDAAPICNGWYAKLSQLAARIVAPRDPTAKLHPYVQNWLKFNAEQIEPSSMAFKVGDSLTVDGIS